MSAWVTVVIIIVTLIFLAVITDKIKQRKIHREASKILPEVRLHIQTGRHYNIFLSHGKMLNNVRFLGISPSHNPTDYPLPFVLCSWIIVEYPDGRRAYLKPESIRYYEDFSGSDFESQVNKSINT